MTAKLTTRQRLFAEYYLADPNATQAAIKAGYSKKTAASQGERLLRNVEIRSLVEKRVENAVITANEILEDVKEIAKNYEAKDSDRLKAYEMLGKHLAMWIDKTEHSGTAKVEIEYVNDWRG